MWLQPTFPSTRRTKNITSNEALLPQNVTTITLDKSKCAPVLLRYNPALRSFSSIIRKHFSILTSSHRCYNIFDSAPIVAVRRTEQQRQQLHCASHKLHNSSQNNIPPNVLFNAAAIVLRAPSYPTGLPLTQFIPQAKQDLLLTSLRETLKAYLHNSVQTLSQTIYGRNKTTIQRSPQRTPHPSWQAHIQPTTVSEHFLTDHHTASEITLIH